MLASAAARNLGASSFLFVTGCDLPLLRMDAGCLNFVIVALPHKSRKNGTEKTSSTLLWQSCNPKDQIQFREASMVPVEQCKRPLAECVKTASNSTSVRPPASCSYVTSDCSWNVRSTFCPKPIRHCRKRKIQLARLRSAEWCRCKAPRLKNIQVDVSSDRSNHEKCETRRWSSDTGFICAACGDGNSMSFVEAADVLATVKLEHVLEAELVALLKSGNRCV